MYHTLVSTMSDDLRRGRSFGTTPKPLLRAVGILAADVAEPGDLLAPNMEGYYLVKASCRSASSLTTPAAKRVSAMEARQVELHALSHPVLREPGRHQASQLMVSPSLLRSGWSNASMNVPRHSTRARRRFAPPLPFDARRRSKEERPWSSSPCLTSRLASSPSKRTLSRESSTGRLSVRWDGVRWV